MLRLEGVKGNAKVRLPERGHIETSMIDGTTLPTTQGIRSSAVAGLGSAGRRGWDRIQNLTIGAKTDPVLPVQLSGRATKGSG